jgi:hypothetical protein
VTLDPTPSIDELLRIQRERIARRGERRGQPEQPSVPAPTWPVKLWIPWSHLVSDNQRFTIAVQNAGGGVRHCLVLRQEYRDAKAAIRGQVALQLGEVTPVAMPLSLVAAVWVPDERPHDCVNFAKLLHDSLEKVIYTNDRWLYSAHWYRAGVRVDQPGADITIAPLEAADAARPRPG